MFSNLKDIRSTAVNNLYAWRQHLAMFLVSTRDKVLVQRSYTIATSTISSRMVVRPCRRVLKVQRCLHSASCSPPDTTRPRGLAAFCPKLKSEEPFSAPIERECVSVCLCITLTLCVCDVSECVCVTPICQLVLRLQLWRIWTSGIVWHPGDRSAAQKPH